MAKKQQAKKKTVTAGRKLLTPKIAVIMFVFLLGAWVGNGGIKYIDGKLLFAKPDWNKFTSAAPKNIIAAAGDKQPLVFWKDGYGDCLVSRIVNVYDGDTFRCDIDEMPHIIGKNISVRVRGIDTPEMNDKNPYTKARAIDAREFAKRKLMTAEKVELRNLDRDKYFRILADVYADGQSLAKMLLEAGLANEYDGGTKEQW